MAARRSLLLLASIVLAPVTGCADEVRVAPSTTEPGSPVLVAYRRPCVAASTEDCSSEAAEFAGTVEVVDGCVLVRNFNRPSEPRALVAVLFPYGVRWSVADGGIVTSDGEVARAGDWIYGGGGGSPIGDLTLLELTDTQRAELRGCAKVAGTQVGGRPNFVEMGANDRIERLDGPPDL